MRPMSESDTETEVESNWQSGGARANGKRNTGGVAPGVGLNGHSAEGRLLGRASLRPHPHSPLVETTSTKSSFFRFGSGKDKAREEDKHRLRNSHGHHQKKFTSRLSKDSDSDSDDESPSGVRGGEFESRIAADSDSDAVESGGDVGGESQKEKEIAVRRLMEVIAKKKGVALTVDLDAPTSTTVHEEEPEKEESEEELVTSNGTIGGEKDRRRKMGWGIFKKEPGNQEGDGVEKREPLPVMKAGERGDGEAEGGKEEGREKEKVGKEKGKFKRMFSRGK